MEIPGRATGSRSVVPPVAPGSATVAPPVAPPSGSVVDLGEAYADLALDVDQLAAREDAAADGEVDRAGERAADGDDGAGAQLQHLAAGHADAPQLAHDLDGQLAQEGVA